MARTRNQRLGNAEGPLLKAALAARKQGWRIVRPRRGHPVWISPCGVQIRCASTPGDCRNADNQIAQLKRAGLVL